MAMQAVPTRVAPDTTRGEGIVNHGSLFSGIGGFDLAAQWMGWTNVFHCERDPFCQRVLQHYWPDATTHTDITTTDFTRYKGKIDILTGGFPCQPFSTAGAQKGTDDERYLWPEMLRAIQEIAPRYVVGENVGGLISWSDGLVFDQVHLDLEAKGYEVAAFILPACAVNAPHRRDRVWFIANRADAGLESMRRRENTVCRSANATNANSKQGGCRTKNFRTGEKWQSTNDIRQNGGSANATNTESVGLQRIEQPNSGKGAKPNDKQPDGCSGKPNWGWQNWPTQSPICSRDDGLSRRLDGITIPAHRTQSIKAYGNAVVPQVVYKIFQSIQEIDNL